MDKKQYFEYVRLITLLIIAILGTAIILDSIFYNPYNPVYSEQTEKNKLLEDSKPSSLTNDLLGTTGNISSVTWYSNSSLVVLLTNLTPAKLYIILLNEDYFYFFIANKSIHTLYFNYPVENSQLTIFLVGRHIDSENNYIIWVLSTYTIEKLGDGQQTAIP